MKLSELVDYPPDYMSDCFVRWDRVSHDQVAALQKAIESARREADMQRYLEANPRALIQHLGGGQGRWVIPQKRFGAQFVPDFVIGERHSFGFEWQLVELESPKAKMFTKAGDPSAALNHAIRQLTDWRAWLKQNQNYASIPREANGLGLTDIDSNAKGLIIIGRRNETPLDTNERRRRMCQDLNAEIHSYDWLVSLMQGRIESLERAHVSRVA